MWHYSWGSNIYSAKRFYVIPFKSISPPPPILWIWKSKCSNKLKVFTWLLLMDRLNTKNILRRKNCTIEGNDYNCVLCNLRMEETSFHMFFECPFSSLCWQALNIHWDFQLQFFPMIQKARDVFQAPFFMEVFIIATWTIWKQRNGLIFRQIRPSFQSWKNEFFKEISLQKHRFRASLDLSFSAWFSSLV